MKRVTLLVFISVAIFSRSAYAQFSNNSVQEDGQNGNIAAGYQSLQLEISEEAGGPNNCDGGQKCGINNAAFGNQALSNNTIGQANTAAGAQALTVNTTGAYDTALGAQALSSNSAGQYNVAVGVDALYGNTTGSHNIGIGSSALASNTSANYNVATGEGALIGTTTGSHNVGTGAGALTANSVGTYNTAVGDEALFYSLGNNNVAVGSFAIAGLDSNTAYTGDSNTGIGAYALAYLYAGSSNTALGYEALEGSGTSTTGNSGWPIYLIGTSNGVDNAAVGAGALKAFTTASYNSALGMQTLYATTTGNYNTASGYEALYENTSGQQNTANGVYALHSNRGGSFNTAVGVDALYGVSSGKTNVGLGFKAGYGVTTGSNNIEIGNQGATTDNGVIKIGTQNTQIATYIAGISGVGLDTAGTAVVVTSTGQLGVAGSSGRFKTAIEPMGESTEKLEKLRPVTFRYKSEPNGARQFGLIAEEVAKVYPELVVRGAKGEAISVRYDELAPMLLNEVQQQAAEIRDLKRQQNQFATQTEVQDLKQQLQAALLKLRGEDKLVARR